jgi:protein SCO1
MTAIASASPLLTRRRWAGRLGALMLGAGLLLGLAGCDRAAPDAPAFQAIDITGANYASAFSLTDPEGRTRTLQEFQGRIVVVFFGFAQCPDVCPTALMEIAEVREALGADGQRVQGIFITVDPERDTPEVLAAYVANFGEDFVALYGSVEETRAVAREFKVFFAKVPSRAGDGNYTIDHTAGAYVFDAKGRIRLFTRHGGGAAALLHDIRLLLAEEARQAG